MFCHVIICTFHRSTKHLTSLIGSLISPPTKLLMQINFPSIPLIYIMGQLSGWCTDTVVFLCCPLFSAVAVGLAPKHRYSTSSTVPSVLLFWYEVSVFSLTPINDSKANHNTNPMWSVFPLVYCFYCTMNKKNKSLPFPSSDWTVWGAWKQDTDTYNCVYLAKSMHLPIWGATHWFPCCIQGIQLISTAGHASEKTGPLGLSQD